MSGRRLIRRLRSYQSGPRKDLAMFRLLSILALSGFCILPDRFSSRQRVRVHMACPTHIIHHRRYRSVRTGWQDPSTERPADEERP